MGEAGKALDISNTLRLGMNKASVGAACVRTRLVASESVRPHGLQPIRLLCPRDSSEEYWGGLPCPPPGAECNIAFPPKTSDLFLPVHLPGIPSWPSQALTTRYWINQHKRHRVSEVANCGPSNYRKPTIVWHLLSRGFY